MSSKTEIANLALTMMGDARVANIDPPEDSEAAILIASLWDILRDDEQRAHAWNFCLARAQLAADVETPSWGYAYQYTLPSDCLRVYEVSDIYVGVSLTNYRTTREQDFSIEQGKILYGTTTTPGTAEALKIRYLKRVELTSLWDSCFSQVFAARLAMTCCERRTYSASKRQLAQGEYVAALKRARRVNAIETPPVPLADNELVLVRL